MTVTPTFEASLLTAENPLRLYGEGVRGERVRGVLCERPAAGGSRS